MNLIKFNGTKSERIIKGTKYIRTEKTIMAVKDYNSYVASSFNSYDNFINRAHDKLTRGMDKENIAVFGEIIKKGRFRSLYLTIFEIVAS